MGASADTLEDVLRVIVNREHQDPDRRQGGAQPRHGGDPGLARQTDVHDHDIGMRFRGPIDSLLSGAGFPDDLEPGHGEGAPDAFPDHGMVVDDHDPNRSFTHRSSRAAGTSTTISIPLGAPGFTSTNPPSATIRSRIPTSPDRPGRPSRPWG